MRTTVAERRPGRTVVDVVGARRVYALTVSPLDGDGTTLLYLASDEADAVGQALAWYARQAEKDRIGMTIHVAPASIGRLADSRPPEPPVYSYGGFVTLGETLARLAGRKGGAA